MVTIFFFFFFLGGGGGWGVWGLGVGSASRRCFRLVISPHRYPLTSYPHTLIIKTYKPPFPLQRKRPNIFATFFFFSFLEP